MMIFQITKTRVSKEAENAFASYNKAVECINAKDYAGAIKNYTEALATPNALSPELKANALLWKARAQVSHAAITLLPQKQYAEALKLCDEASKEPTLPDAFKNTIAQIRAAVPPEFADTESANRETLMKVKDIVFDAAALHDMRKLEKAVNEYVREFNKLASDADSKNICDLFVKAITLHAKHQYADAAKIYVDVIESTTMSARFKGMALKELYNLANTAYSEKNSVNEQTVSGLSEAIKYLNLVIPFSEQLNEYSPSYRYLRGNCYRLLAYYMGKGSFGEVKLDGENKTIKQLASAAVVDFKKLEQMLKSMDSKAILAFRAEHDLSEGWSLENALNHSKEMTH